MKRFLQFGALALALVLVSGCGSSSKGTVLSCSKSVSEDEGSYKETEKMTFTDGKVSKVGMEIEMTFNEGDPADYKAFYDAAFSESKDGISYSSKTKGKTLTISIDADLAKVSAEDLEDLDMSVKEGTYESLKAEYEENGYTCK